MATWTPMDNGYGENIPDSFQVILLRDYSDSIQGPEGIPPGKAAAEARQSVYRYSPVMQTTVTSGGAFNTLDQSDMSFIYMDCGRWGGDQHTLGGLAKAQRGFGLVWGTWVALCQFVPDATMSNNKNYITTTVGGDERMKDNLINDVIDSLRGPSSSVRVLKWEWAAGRLLKGQMDWNFVYVILPDLHVPVVTSAPDYTPVLVANGSPYRFLADGPAMGRVAYIGVGCDNNGVNPISGGLDSTALAWYRKYMDGDIFGAPNGSAARDLIQFLQLLEKSSLSQKIRFCQLGDLYDLWIGLKCFFNTHSDQIVELKNIDGIMAGSFCDYWTQRTDNNFVSMMTALKNLKVAQKNFLWGNHDNYLAAHRPTGWAADRTRAIREDKGIYIEHGHRGDSMNRDGATGMFWLVNGQTVTNWVFDYPILRSLDPNRRADFARAAAFDYVTNPNFSVYVMGHTHSPYLTKIKVVSITPGLAAPRAG